MITIRLIWKGTWIMKKGLHNPNLPIKRKAIPIKQISHSFSTRRRNHWAWHNSWQHVSFWSVLLFCFLMKFAIYFAFILILWISFSEPGNTQQIKEWFIYGDETKKEGRKKGEMEREITASQEYYIESAFHCCENKTTRENQLGRRIY